MSKKQERPRCPDCHVFVKRGTTTCPRCAFYNDGEPIYE
jgi:RNA polymerase subunit RPABC4/transcription elongation factor Spt4